MSNRHFKPNSGFCQPISSVLLLFYCLLLLSLVCTPSTKISYCFHLQNAFHTLCYSSGAGQHDLLPRLWKSSSHWPSQDLQSPTSSQPHRTPSLVNPTTLFPLPQSSASLFRLKGISPSPPPSPTFPVSFADRNNADLTIVSAAGQAPSCSRLFAVAVPFPQEALFPDGLMSGFSPSLRSCWMWPCRGTPDHRPSSHYIPLDSFVHVQST